MASGNFGTPITAALQHAGFTVTIITRSESKATFPPDIPVITTTYTLENLTSALAGQDAAVCVVGPGGIGAQVTMIDAAEAAGVKRFILDDFGWGDNPNSFPEFNAIHAQRRAGWDHAKAKAESNPNFTYTGISIGNPIDWVSDSTGSHTLASQLTSSQGVEALPCDGVRYSALLGRHL